MLAGTTSVAAIADVTGFPCTSLAASTMRCSALNLARAAATTLSHSSNLFPGSLADSLRSNSLPQLTDYSAFGPSLEPEVCAASLASFGRRPAATRRYSPS